MQAVKHTESLDRIRCMARRDWRQYPVDKVVDFMTNALGRPGCQMPLRPVQAIALAELHDFGGGFWPIQVGGGKAVPDSSPILHERGWVPISQVRPGDRVYGSQGTLVQVLGVFPQGERDVYKVTFSDRTEAFCDLDHLWTLRDNFKSSGRHPHWVTRTLGEFQASGLYRIAGKNPHKVWRYFLPMTEPVQYPHRTLPVDPYTLGALLGDGGLSQATINFTTMDQDILDALVLPRGVTAKPCTHQNSGRATQYNLTGRKGQANPLVHALRGLGVCCKSRDKSIPRQYLTASVDQRLALAQGLLDTDGEQHRGGAIFSSVSRQLALDVQELWEGLGASATLVERQNHYRVSIRPRIDTEPFRCARKLGPWREQAVKKQRPPGRSVRSVEFSHKESCTCLAVYSPDHLFQLRHNVLTHNTLISLLAAKVVNAKRPVLLVPASLREKTLREARTVYARHYHLPTISIQSYQTLSRDYDGWLEKKAPDLIVADECHYLKSTKAACTRKVSRYISASRKAGRTVRFVGMSGTAVGRSLQEFVHLLRWALGDNAPVPQDWREIAEWGLALNARVEDWNRLMPGPLLTLGTYDRAEPSPVTQARQAFGDRLYHTPGVIVVRGERPDAGLEIRARVVDLPHSLDEHFRRLREDWETPDGHPFEYAFDLWRHARELATGFFYVWDPRPPEEWLNPRRAWHMFVRDTLKRSRKFDSAGQLIQAVLCGQVDDGGTYAAWVQVRDTFAPNSVPVWVDDTVLHSAADWLSKEKGLCWVEHKAFGQRLAQLTGLPHFQEKGVDPASGLVVDQHSGPGICQVKPCSTGFNLQAHHYKNLIVSTEPTGNMYEQQIGRTHRSGQEQDTVFVDHIFACKEQLQGFWNARQAALYAKETPPTEQKLAYATIDVPETIPASQGAAWK